MAQPLSGFELSGAAPLAAFQGVGGFGSSSALLCFHRNKFNLDPFVEGVGDSGERTERDISCGRFDERYFGGVHPRPRRELRLIQIFLFSQPGNLDAQFKIYKLLLDEIPNLRVSHLPLKVTIQAGSHLIHLFPSVLNSFILLS